MRPGRLNGRGQQPGKPQGSGLISRVEQLPAMTTRWI